ncbi:hypothetical protein [Leptospira ilyithenensis]|uniref:Uncharacterized protein n=1 Tax=Leptospira ilyithenensis TaxID=2484901 RepID=A0A4R9LRS9_9LEPT|nr:hypothetical protein [Leptospira ilyithenensis]TGN09363.1 hypothetical protein EHS11_12485 [Leptospira ilyithenensis]
MEIVNLLNMIAILIVIYAMFGFFDAIILHLWKFQLYKFRETRKEHILHTVRSILFPIIILGMLVFQLQGIFLYLFLAIVVFDLLFQAWDMWIEREARQRFEGLSSLEYTIHGILISLHSVFLTLFVLYHLENNHFQSFKGGIAFLDYSLSFFIAWNLLPGAFIIGTLHIILLHPYFTKDHGWEKYFRFRLTLPGLN